MRKILLLLMFMPLALAAQNKFGYYSHKEVLDALPEYQRTIDEFELLKQRCDAEIEHNEQELTRKYVAFLNGQQDFPEPILRKRQKELQQMVDNSVLFRDRLKEWLAQAKDSLFTPHDKAVAIALEKVCTRMKLAYAINSDEAHYKYVNPDYAEDITQLVIDETLHPTKKELPVVTECAETEVAAEESNVVTEEVLDDVENTEASEDSSSEATTVIADVTNSVATDTVTVVTDAVATDTVTVATDAVE